MQLCLISKGEKEVKVRPWTTYLSGVSTRDYIKFDWEEKKMSFLLNMLGTTLAFIVMYVAEILILVISQEYKYLYHAAVYSHHGM